MADKPKMCMLCGIREVETSSICPTCAESVKREAMGQQATVKRQAEKEIRRQGVNPDSVSQHAQTVAGNPIPSPSKYWDINCCTDFPLLPPWRGKVGMGGKVASVWDRFPSRTAHPHPPPSSGSVKKLLSGTRRGSG